MSAGGGKAVADEISGMFSDGFFDDAMVSSVAEVIDRHIRSDPARAALVEALKGLLPEAGKNFTNSDTWARHKKAIAALKVAGESV